MGDLGCGNGGSAPVMKIDGNKVYYRQAWANILKT